MSYFRLNLLSYLRDSHPDKANDLSFIAGRGNMAAEIANGSNPYSTFLGSVPHDNFLRIVS
ncbi:DUF1896 domain-containing protein [Bacteroidales bacterium OttesenSCG-928-I14]|nr:DUF1896 domain-containing protein [Bacteroidales bacterium OttesenSCG-928-I14]